VPENYICSLENFVSPPKEILTLFVGKRSITGLQRTELASLFGWNSTFLGREINNGHIRFLNWVLLLLFCGVSIKKFIDLKKLLDTMWTWAFPGALHLVGRFQVRYSLIPSGRFAFQPPNAKRIMPLHSRVGFPSPKEALPLHLGKTKKRLVREKIFFPVAMLRI